MSSNVSKKDLFLSGVYSFVGGFLLPICPPAGIAMIALGAEAEKSQNTEQINSNNNEILNIIP